MEYRTSNYLVVDEGDNTLKVYYLSTGSLLCVFNDISIFEFVDGDGNILYDELEDYINSNTPLCQNKFNYINFVMGTNFYARVIPKKSRIENLKKSIDEQDIDKINEQIQEIFGLVDEYNRIGSKYHLGKRSMGWKFLWNSNCFVKRNGHTEETIVEGGARTGSIIKFVSDPSTLEQTYELTKEGIKDFILRDDIVIVDEYVEYNSIRQLKDIKQDKSDEYSTILFDKDEKLAWFEEMLKLDGYGGESYDKKDCGSIYKSCFVDNSEYSEFGTLIKEKYPDVRFTGQHDFYNDGMRFSTSTSFS